LKRFVDKELTVSNRFNAS